MLVLRVLSIVSTFDMKTDAKQPTDNRAVITFLIFTYITSVKIIHKIKPSTYFRTADTKPKFHF